MQGPGRYRVGLAFLASLVLLGCPRGTCSGDGQGSCEPGQLCLLTVDQGLGCQEVLSCEPPDGGGCTPGLRCQDSAHQVQQCLCSAVNTCGGGSVCAADGSCALACSVSPDCPTGSVCVGGACEESCREEGGPQCPYGMTCVTRSTPCQAPDGGVLDNCDPLAYRVCEIPRS